ncbi:unnamed protein product [Caenorhabditis sp. 36 PRJEB53466]|nr:unnamed protein product [Caenorhabditis sp. 36 PRJEB53466]
MTSVVAVPVREGEDDDVQPPLTPHNGPCRRRMPTPTPMRVGDGEEEEEEQEQGEEETSPTSSTRYSLRARETKPKPKAKAKATSERKKRKRRRETKPTGENAELIIELQKKLRKKEAKLRDANRINNKHKTENARLLKKLIDMELEETSNKFNLEIWKSELKKECKKSQEVIRDLEKAENEADEYKADLEKLARWKEEDQLEGTEQNEMFRKRWMETVQERDEIDAKFQSVKPSCRICFNHYIPGGTRPKILKCGHTICRACTIQIANPEGPHVKCPFCNTEMNKERFLADTRTNFALEDLIEIYDT